MLKAQKVDALRLWYFCKIKITQEKKMFFRLLGFTAILSIGFLSGCCVDSTSMINQTSAVSIK